MLVGVGLGFSTTAARVWFRFEGSFRLGAAGFNSGLLAFTKSGNGSGSETAGYLRGGGVKPWLGSSNGLSLGRPG